MSSKPASAAAQAAASPPPPIASLPDPLLGRVLELAGMEAGPAAALVSHRWWQAVYEHAPALWHKFALYTVRCLPENPQRLPAKL